jgi:hypothetical protein
MVEGVAELLARRHVRLAKAGQVGRDNVEVFAQQRNQVAEHVSRAREAMQQKQLGFIGRTCFAIKDLQAVDVGVAIADGGHGSSPLRCRVNEG